MSFDDATHQVVLSVRALRPPKQCLPGGCGCRMPSTGHLLDWQRMVCVCLQAVHKATLVQLRGQTAKGYGFDRFYSPEQTSDRIYDDAVAPLVDNLFKVQWVKPRASLCNTPPGKTWGSGLCALSFRVLALAGLVRSCLRACVPTRMP